MGTIFGTIFETIFGTIFGTIDGKLKLIWPKFARKENMLFLDYPALLLLGKLTIFEQLCGISIVNNFLEIFGTI